MAKIKLMIRRMVGLAATGMVVLGCLMAGNVYQGYKDGQNTYQSLSDTYTFQLSREAETSREDGQDLERERRTQEKPQTESPADKALQAAANEDNIPDDAPKRLEIDWKGLKNINTDVVAWIFLPGLELSYPVMQAADNGYYLHRDIKQEYLFAGSIFLDSYNSSDFANYNSIIYGHNMRDGSMFAKLKDYQDSQILKSCPYFWVFTPMCDYLYRIFSVHTAKSGGETYMLRFADQDSYMDWLNTMQSASSVETDVKVSEKLPGKVVTLSTCTENQEVRQVVQGILIGEVKVSKEESA